MSALRFTEDSRVKIPALLHLSRLGYGYLSLKDLRWNPRSNIVTEIFEAAVLRLRPDITLLVNGMPLAFG
jgi:type I restriction enzyme R subunit